MGEWANPATYCLVCAPALPLRVFESTRFLKPAVRVSLSHGGWQKYARPLIPSTDPMWFPAGGMCCSPNNARVRIAPPEAVGADAIAAARHTPRDHASTRAWWE